MKTTNRILLALFGCNLLTSACVALPLPIQNGVLTGTLNANGQAMTNVGSIKFGDGTTLSTASGLGGNGGGNASYATNSGYATNAGYADVATTATTATNLSWFDLNTGDWMNFVPEGGPQMNWTATGDDGNTTSVGLNLLTVTYNQTLGIGGVGTPPVGSVLVFDGYLWRPATNGFTGIATNVSPSSVVVTTYIFTYGAEDTKANGVWYPDPTQTLPIAKGESFSATYTNLGGYELQYYTDGSIACGSFGNLAYNTMGMPGVLEPDASPAPAPTLTTTNISTTVPHLNVLMFFNGICTNNIFQ